MTRATQGRPSRRSFLTLGAAVGAAGLAGALVAPAATADVGIQASQWDWRFCDKCYMLFFWGYPSKGVCRAGGAHNAQGWNFQLFYDIPSDGRHQPDWRFCEKCYVVFYEPHRGTCATGGFHRAQGWNFVMPHSMGYLPNRQANWYHCLYCAAMFFNGYTSYGSCPGNNGYGHHKEGFEFCIYHN